MWPTYEEGVRERDSSDSLSKQDICKNDHSAGGWTALPLPALPVLTKMTEGLDRGTLGPHGNAFQELRYLHSSFSRLKSDEHSSGTWSILWLLPSQQKGEINAATPLSAIGMLPLGQTMSLHLTDVTGLVRLRAQS